MGGHASITLVGGTAELLSAAFGLLDECEQLWSRFIPSSDISRLNSAEGAPTIVDPLTVRLIEEMRRGSHLTDGDFDPTLLPALVEAGYARSVVNHELTTLLPASARYPGSLAGIVVEGNTVTMPLGTTLDSGGIGKGFAADLIGMFVLDAGAWGALIEAGGDVVAVGKAPDDIAWRIGIEDPYKPGSHVDIVRLTSGAVVTSSQRKRRWKTPEGKRHHLINPRTGDSASSDIQTVSVIAATGARAETFTKPGFLRDSVDYLAWLPTVGAAGLLIDTEGVTMTSENWKDYS
jgi:thiamine biosynthesis lipoprotein